MKDVASIILTGGKSKRMGSDKCALKLSDKSILAELIDLAGPISSEIILAGGQFEKLAAYEVKTVQDEAAGLGPLSGILAGLKGSNSEHNLVVSCDMPFVNRDLIKEMIGRAAGNDVVVCESPNGLEPLCALYSKACIPHIEAALAKGERKVISFFGEVRVEVIAQGEVAKIDPDFLTFFNINTPLDFERAREIREMKLTGEIE
ncbi:MAG: molybdenum cofactor guanylyltransferase [Actinomycetota bacterium]|nr:molybdenum cofactor guanylyltransferase [Actinomycetota bacterium]